MSVQSRGEKPPHLRHAQHCVHVQGLVLLVVPFAGGVFRTWDLS